MQYAVITDAQIDFLKANPVPNVDQFHTPYAYVIENQRDDCTLSKEQVIELTQMMHLMPHVALVDYSEKQGRETRYAAYYDGSLSFLEIGEEVDGRCTVTALSDRDHAYVLGYFGR